jgi:glycerol-3-phosphate acyltransferase PlsY
VDPLALAAVVAGYLLGSIDFGVIVPKMRGVDIYSQGSGNPGTTNVLRAMGRKAAAAVMVGDMTKGLAAAAIGDLTAGEAAGFAAGFAAVVGHCFPVWHRFRGGKGVATAGGAMLWLEPVLGIVLLAVWALLAYVAKRASVASLLLALALVPGALVFGHRGWSLLWAGAAALLVVVRHRENIRRLLTGAERRIAA